VVVDVSAPVWPDDVVEAVARAICARRGGLPDADVISDAKVALSAMAPFMVAGVERAAYEREAQVWAAFNHGAAQAAARIRALEAALRRQMARYPQSSVDYQDALAALTGADNAPS